MTTPADLYRTCRVSARRLETRQRYDVTGDEERLRAFLAGEPLPPPSPGKLADLELITSLRRKGRYIGRVHVVSLPLTDYLRYELAVYAENAAAGEDVRIADGSRPILAELDQDFALFDSETAILFDYDDAGKVRGYRIADDRATVTRCIRQYMFANAGAVPLNDFMAADRAA